MDHRKCKMIKKFLVLLFLMGMAGLTGCKKEQESEQIAEKETGKETEIEAETEAEKEISDLYEEQYIEMGDQEETEDPVLFDNLSHIAVIVDHETMETESYELPEGSSYVCGDEEKLYYIWEEPKRAYYQIYAIDRRDKETILVGEKYMKGKMEGAYLAAVESFGGKLYVLWITGGYEGDHAFRESVFVLQEDGTYRETEVYQNVYDTMAENEYDLIKGGRRMNRARLYTIPLCMEMFGEIYAETADGRSMVVLDQKGEVKRTLTYPDALSSVVFLGKNTILYIDKDKKLMLYDRNQNMSEVVMEKYHHILDYEDGMLYYYESEEAEFALWEYKVYQYDMERKKTAMLYSAQSALAGAQVYEPKISGFCVKEGICYYIGTDGTDAAWYLYDPHTKKEKMLKTDVKLWHYSYSDYGTVTYKSETAVCPNCGKELCSVYDERFILDDSFPNAEKVNACLLEDYEQTMDDVEKYTEEEQDQCEWHDEEDGPLETIQRGVRNVKTVGGHYLQVSMGGYWYGGGAHGMPIMDYLLFDLDTGEQVTFQELYRGSEEEFRELAVEYTVENWKKGENGYFAQTEEELAKEVYESVTLDMLICFDENGIVLEYSPYWLGPYASGFIEVPIPYEALEMDEKFVK